MCVISLYVSADFDTSAVVERLRRTVAQSLVYYIVIIVVFLQLLALTSLNILSHLYQARCEFFKHMYRSINTGVGDGKIVPSVLV